MSLFEFMTWAEVSLSNDILEEQNANIAQMQREQEYERQRQASQDRNQTLVSEFEKLYKSGGNIDVVQMHKIVELKGYINSQFNSCTRQYYRNSYPKPNYKRHIPYLFIGMIASAYLSTRLVPFNILVWGMFVFALIYSYAKVQDIRDDIRTARNNTKRQKEYEENARQDAKTLANEFPELSAYGVYLKCFLDDQIQSVADALEPLYPHNDRRKLIEKFYTLFELKTRADSNYNSRYIHSMDGFYLNAFKG